MTTPDLPTRFYRAFAALDDERMNACYAPAATFRDPIFDLSGRDEISSMWTALCTAPREFRLNFQVQSSTEVNAVTTWQADYLFGPDARQVHNEVSTTMIIVDGLIVAQVDDFSFHGWARQALGPAGLLLGWASPFQAKVAERARRSLGI